MLNRFQSRKSTAAVVIGAAALIGLGGTTTAVAHGLIDSHDIRNGTVHSADVRNSNLRSIDVARNTLRSIDIRNGVIGMRDLNQYTQDKIEAAGGAQGPKGDQGPKGEPGAPGKDGVSGYEPVSAEVRWSQANNVTETVVKCDDGKVALGGGYEIDKTANGSAVDTEILDNGPVFADGTARAWRVAGVPSGEVNVKAWVTCATVS